jgi:PIN domain nuclease of toxin-antitoxin system
MLLWLLDSSPRLRPAARQAIEQATEVYVSAASVWELRLKESKGKLKLLPQFEASIVNSGLKELPVSFAHTLAYRTLHLQITDPFDRMLLAQAQTERLILLTDDRPVLAAHPRQTLNVL